jgi:Ca2+-binding RTX toxin-like protein
LSISGVGNPVNGTATLNQDGNIEFTPAANFNGTASFEYTITDGTENAIGAVDVAVNPFNDAPIANKDTITTNEDTSVTMPPTQLLNNDSDVDTKDKLSIVGISNSVNGTAILNQDGKIQFTPAANFNGTASFNYTLSDGTVNTTGAVDVAVNPVNDAPTIIKPFADLTVTQFAPNTIVELFGHFKDIDYGNLPEYSVEVSGDSLASIDPLSFQRLENNEPVLVFGFPDNLQGTFTFTVKATYGGNESISDTFSVFRINSTQNGDQLIGRDGNDYLDGKEGDDTLTGVDGNDTLIGSEGNDSLIGGNGDDTYIVDNTTDVLTENANGGTDTVASSITYNLGSNIENITLTGTSSINGTGNTLNNIITGNTANNVLSGDAGNDSLNGGAGIDTLIGSGGNDTMTAWTGNDSLTGGAGNDTMTGGADSDRFIYDTNAAFTTTGGGILNCL